MSVYPIREEFCTILSNAHECQLGVATAILWVFPSPSPSLTCLSRLKHSLKDPTIGELHTKDRLGGCEGQFKLITHCGVVHNGCITAHELQLVNKSLTIYSQ